MERTRKHFPPSPHLPLLTPLPSHRFPSIPFHPLPISPRDSPPSSSPISNHYRYNHIIQKIILAFYALSATLVLITAGNYVLPMPVSFLLASFPVGLFICCTDCPGYSTGIRFFPLRSFPLYRKTLIHNTG